MTSDFVLGQLRLALVAFLSYAGGRGWLSPQDSTLVLSIATALAPIMLPVVWSWYANWQKKSVPHNSVAVAKEDVVGGSVVGSKVAPSNGTMKVVGCIAALLLVLPLYMASAHAANLPTKAPTNILAGFQKFSIDDANAALADAQAQNPPDADAVQCWSQMVTFLQAIKPVSPNLKPGLFLALQKARDANNALQQVQSNVGPIAQLKKQCASVIIDTQDFLVKLGVLGAGAVVNPLNPIKLPF